MWQVVWLSNIYAMLLHQEQCHGLFQHRCGGCALNKYVSIHAEFSWSSCCFHWWYWSNCSFKAEMPELKCSLWKLVSKRGVSIAVCVSCSLYDHPIHLHSSTPLHTDIEQIQILPIYAIMTFLTWTVKSKYEVFTPNKSNTNKNNVFVWF